jgi:hypothetical protein
VMTGHAGLRWNVMASAFVNWFFWESEGQQYYKSDNKVTNEYNNIIATNLWKQIIGHSMDSS